MKQPPNVPLPHLRYNSSRPARTGIELVLGSWQEQVVE